MNFYCLIFLALTWIAHGIPTQKTKQSNLVETSSNAASEDMASSVKGDPHLAGFDGSHFDFEGEPGAVFNLITDTNFQLNALFVANPLREHRTYMGALGIKIDENDIVISPNGQVLLNEDVVTDFSEDVFLLAEKGGHAGVLHFGLHAGTDVFIQTEGFQVSVRTVKRPGLDYLNIECVAHAGHLKDPHGILGQTAAFMVKGTIPIPADLGHKDAFSVPGFLQGVAKNYLVVDGILGSDFHFNRFGAQQEVEHERATALGFRRFAVSKVQGA